MEDQPASKKQTRSYRPWIFPKDFSLWTTWQRSVTTKQPVISGSRLTRTFSIGSRRSEETCRMTRRSLRSWRTVGCVVLQGSRAKSFCFGLWSLRSLLMIKTKRRSLLLIRRDCHVLSLLLLLRKKRSDLSKVYNFAFISLFSLFRSFSLLNYVLFICVFPVTIMIK